MLDDNKIENKIKLEDELWHPSVDVDAFTTACCDLDLYLQNLIRSSVGASGYSLSFHWDCSSRSWDIMVTRSVRINEQTNERTWWTDSLKT